MAGIHSCPLELLVYILLYVITEPADLTVRFASRSFRDASWRALAKLISKYGTFDMMSGERMTALWQISQNKDVASHITRLQMESFCVPGYLSGQYHKWYDAKTAMLYSMQEKMLRPSRLDQLRRLREQDSIWTQQDRSAYMTATGTAAAEDNYTAFFLAECFKEFTKLSSLTLTVQPVQPWQEDYIDIPVPKRYLSLSTEFEIPVGNSGDPGEYCKHPEYVASAIMATDCLLRALSMTRKQLKELELPIEEMGIHAFTLAMSSSNLLEPIRSVECLQLRQICPSLRPEAPRFYEMNFTAMPHLRKLHLDLERSWYRGHNDLLRDVKFPTVTDLTLRCAQVQGFNESGCEPTQCTQPDHGCDSLAFQLLRLLTPTLQYLEIINLVVGPWKDFLRLCAGANLKLLTLDVEYGAPIGARILHELPAPYWPELYAAAEQIDLKDDYLELCKKVYIEVVLHRPELDIFI